MNWHDLRTGLILWLISGIVTGVCSGAGTAFVAWHVTDKRLALLELHVEQIRDALMETEMARFPGWRLQTSATRGQN